MKNLISTIVVLFSSCLLFAGCGKHLPEDAVYDPRFPEAEEVYKEAQSILDKANYVFMRDNALVELFVKVEDDLIQVPNYQNLPENISANFNIIRDKQGNIIYVAEFPYSESADWDNIYESVFNSEGDLIKFVRQSTFLHTDSLNNKIVVYEKSEYYYNARHKLLKKTYEIKYGHLDELPAGVSVEFPYRFKYKKYKTRKRWLRAYGLKK